MSVSDKALTDTIKMNWKSILEGFSRQHDMQFQETLRWVSNRTSLQVACEVLGVSLSPSIATRYTNSDLEILNQLGDFLHSRGFEVPRLMEYHRLEYKQKGRQQHMGFSLSREEYLMERAEGKSKNKIAKQQGISGPALFHWLHKWGLKDPAVEQKEIERLKLQNSAVADELPEPIEQDTHIEEPVSTVHEDSTATSTRDVTRDSRSVVIMTPGPIPPVPEVQNGFPRSSLQIIRVDTTGKHQSSHTQLFDRENLPRGSNDAGPVPIKLTMPIIPVEVPEALQLGALSRDELMHAGLSLVQRAIGQAYHDLVGLLGESAAQNQVQHYIEHQIQRFIQDLSNS